MTRCIHNICLLTSSFMLRRYEPVPSQILDKAEKERHYQQHMNKMGKIRCAIDTSHPDLSPRHKLIAQRAAERQRSFRKSTLSARKRIKETDTDGSVSAIKSFNNERKISYKPEVYSYSASMFKSAPPIQPLDSYDFVKKYEAKMNAQKALNKSKLGLHKSAFVTQADEHIEEEDDILDKDIMSDDDSSTLSNYSDSEQAPDEVSFSVSQSSIHKY